MAALVSAAAGVRADDDAAAAPFWRAPPRSELTADARGVVVVGAVFDAPFARGRGNGVVVAGDVDGEAWILTCAHVVERDGAPARQVRVGLHLVSSTAHLQSGRLYGESVARVVSSNAAQDVALLAVRVASPLFAVKGGVSVGPEPTTIVSLVPFSAPTVQRAIHHQEVIAGQSGSPVLCNGRLVGLVRGGLAGGRLAFDVGVHQLRAFLEAVPGGAALVAGWDD